MCSAPQHLQVLGAKYILNPDKKCNPHFIYGWVCRPSKPSTPVSGLWITNNEIEVGCAPGGGIGSCQPHWITINTTGLGFTRSGTPAPSFDMEASSNVVVQGNTLSDRSSAGSLRSLVGTKIATSLWQKQSTHWIFNLSASKSHTAQYRVAEGFQNGASNRDLGRVLHFSLPRGCWVQTTSRIQDLQQNRLIPI